jgi:Tfp pilus assembly protein PilF
MPYLSWQTVVMGDPLCAPFRTQTLSRDQAMPDLDPETELPKFFSARGVARLTAGGVGAQAARLLLKAGTRIAQGDVAGAREPLQMATSLDPRLTSAHLILAQVYEQTAEYDKAIERYRAVLAVSPNDIVSLNNLAFALAVRKGAPAEALPLAQTAYRLSGSTPQVTDTLGWIYHLLGREADAEKYLTEASKGSPPSVDAYVHLAEVYAAMGLKSQGLAALNKAINLDAQVENRTEVQQLRATLNQK